MKPLIKVVSIRKHLVIGRQFYDLQKKKRKPKVILCFRTLSQIVLGHPKCKIVCSGKIVATAKKVGVLPRASQA